MAIMTVQGHSHDDAFMLALAVWKARVEQFSKEDQNDLFEATKAFVTAQTEEESTAARMAMMEIMDQQPSKVVDVTLSGDRQRIGKWLQFVSQKIREARDAKGWTQGQLAENAGLTQSHVSRLENGDHSPNNKTLTKIANALGVPLAAFDPCADDQ